MTRLRDEGADSPNEYKKAIYYVLGSTHVGTLVAEQLQAAGHRVAIVGCSYRSDDIPVLTGDPATIDALVDAGMATASTVIVATRSDRRNLLIAQLVRARFDVPEIITFVNDPDRVPLFADAGHEPFCVATAIAEKFGETI
jgi:trk system potassium uptake protein TrkA